MHKEKNRTPAEPNLPFSEDEALFIKKQSPDDRVIALAGNPNVGKSTLFNALTGLRQHTGNWPGKTVASAQGRYTYQEQEYILVDLPGTYSLLAHSAEEEVARDFICFGGPDVTVVICDATCLERNLNLVLQTIEITPRVVVCLNMMDEAKKKQIQIDIPALSKGLGVPVVGISAAEGKGLEDLQDQIRLLAFGAQTPTPPPVEYPPGVEAAVGLLEPAVARQMGDCTLGRRWIARKLLEDDPILTARLSLHLGWSPFPPEVMQALGQARQMLHQTGGRWKDKMVACLLLRAEELAKSCVRFGLGDCHQRDRKIDKLITSRWFGFPLMVLLLLGVFWITIAGANYPSGLLSDLLMAGQEPLLRLFKAINAPSWVGEMLVLGVYRVLSWVVSVMLPPMAIFFPLFTLLEDLGYLPRVAFNLDKYFKKACACGKQALTMCQGFGCNAVGVIGCRIIDSPRERLIAIITNSMVPCNGRFPTLIAIISMYFAVAGGFWGSALSALLLTGVIVLGVVMTLLASRLLSKTLLKGVPSSFTLELPPYRKPQIGKVIVRSVFDRTLFVLGRAVMVAAPAGMVIWVMANLTVGGSSLLAYCTNFFDPFARLLGLDGVILMAFILGLPANEVVVPIMVMAYLSSGTILEMESLEQFKALLQQNGWSWLTALNTLLFTLFHWPCSTTSLTIYKETKSVKWTAVSFLMPACIGLLLCLFTATAARLLGLA